MTNKTHLEFTDPWSIREDRRAGLFAWVIMGLLMGFFIGMIVRDIVLKCRTGEFQEELKTFWKLIVSIVAWPFKIFEKDNYMPVWYATTNKFRPPDQQRVWKTKKQLEEEEKQQEKEKERGPFDHKAIIERLGGGWPPRNPRYTSGLSSTGIKGKGIGVQHLPRIAELSSPFQIPGILPSSRNSEDNVLRPISVHGSYSGSNSISQLTTIFNSESSHTQYEKPMAAGVGMSMERDTEAEKKPEKETEKEVPSTEEAEKEASSTEEAEKETSCTEKAGEPSGAQQDGDDAPE
ncbi:hypothetical protein ACLX1H_005109 [Fusarium chlamydosporum]